MIEARPMATEIRPTRVPDPRLSSRLLPALIVMGLALVVAAGIFGREDIGGPSSSPSPGAAMASSTPARPGSATASPEPSTSATPAASPSAASSAATSTPPLPSASPAPSSAPPSPSPSPRETVPPVTATTMATLAEPATLAPSGIETLSPDPGAPWRVVADADGQVWASGSGRLTRFDPATGRARTWTIDDDARFAAGNVVAARAGGVWLIATRVLRRFDGAGFRETVDIGASINAAVEAPDGTLWAATADGAVVHVAGAVRTRIGLPALKFGTAIAVDAAGRLWCVWTEQPSWGPSGLEVGRYDGSAWRIFDGQDAVPLGGFVSSITGLADGSLWILTDGGVVRFDGSSWTRPTADVPRLANVSSVASGPDGSLWIGATDSNDGSVTVGHLEGGSWRLYGPSEGLPSEGWVASVVPVRGRVLVGTGAGIYAFSGGGWRQVWPTASRPGPQGSWLVPVSRDEAWVADGADVWHFLRGTWSRSSVLRADAWINGFARTPDGTVWATVDGGQQSGLYTLRGSTWTRVGDETAGALALGPDGLLWVTGEDPTGGDRWLARSYAFDGRTWSEHSRTSSTDLGGAPWRIAVGNDGTLWVTAGGGWGGPPNLVRYIRGRWEKVEELAGHRPFQVSALTVAPDGDLWMVGSEYASSGPGAGSRTPRIARFDGRGWYVLGQAGGLREGSLESVAAARDGTIWVAGSTGLARFDGFTWRTFYGAVPFASIAVAPDGALWAIGPTGVERLRGLSTSP